MYPTLSISASGGLNSFKATNWFNIPASLFGLAAGGLVQPLIQKKQLSTAYRLAQVDREKTVLEFRQSVLNAVGEVSNAMVRIEKLKTQQQIALERVNTLNAAISNASLLFRTGMATYLEVIVAQSNVLQSELELAAITRDQLSARVELYRSLGGGWK
jgi:multidrug efflux system outer membrane protein